MPPAGEAKPDWWLLAQVAQRLGFHEGFTDASGSHLPRTCGVVGFENNGQRAFDISGLAGMSDAQWDAMKPVQWPINARYPEGCARLFSDRHFYHPDGKARLLPPATPQSVVCETAYPLLMNSGRIRDQWHTMTRTGWFPGSCSIVMSHLQPCIRRTHNAMACARAHWHGCSPTRAG